MSKSLPKQKKLVPISQAAKILGVSIDTIRRWDKSGVIHSERPDGKNRYFSLSELEEHKLSQPLPISEVAKQLNISPTTLRRLDAKGLIKPQRNNAGERVYDRESLKSFLNSDYILRKKQLKVKDKVPPPLPEEKKLDIENDPPFSAESAGEVPLSWKVKFLQRMPEFLGAAVIFLLLIAIGMTNIMVSQTKTAVPSILGITNVINSKISNVKPEDLGSTNVIYSKKESPSTYLAPSKSPIPSQSPPDLKEEEASTVSAQPQKTLTINSSISKSRSKVVIVYQKPDSNSQVVAIVSDGDTLEYLLFNSGWYEVKLDSNSIGFISADDVEQGDKDN